MVEPNRGNTLRRNRGNQSSKRRGDYTSGRGFYRRLVRGLGPSGRARAISSAALSAVFGLLIANASLAQAQSSILTETPSIPLAPASTTTGQSNFDQAVNAYEIRDFATALTLAKAAAGQGHAEAQVMTAHILLRGEAGFVDHNMAVDNYRKAAAQRNVDAYMGLGEMALRSLAGLSPSDALQWFSAAAQVGRRDAMRAIGEMYLKGQGIPPDAEKAKHWLDRAAQSGDHLAHRKMADSLFESDPVKALEYYEKAAATGDSEAAYIAAIMYEENLQIRPNSNRMAELMRQAAESGHAAALADYGLLVYQGRGVTRDIAAAAGWFEKSAKAGDSEGQFLYAFTLAKGEGVQQNYEEAYYWLLKSGESGISDYDKDKQVLRERLEQNIDPAILDRARARVNSQ